LKLDTSKGKEKNGGDRKERIRFFLGRERAVCVTLEGVWGRNDGKKETVKSKKESENAGVTGEPMPSETKKSRERSLETGETTTSGARFAGRFVRASDHYICRTKKRKGNRREDPARNSLH